MISASSPCRGLWCRSPLLHDRAAWRWNGLAELGSQENGGELSTDDIRPMNSLTGSDHSSRSSEAKLFGIEFSDLHVSKEDSIKARCDQLDSQLFEAEYLADEDSVLVPANVATIIDSSQLEPLRVRELRQLAR